MQMQRIRTELHAAPDGSFARLPVFKSSRTRYQQLIPAFFTNIRTFVQYKTQVLPSNYAVSSSKVLWRQRKQVSFCRSYVHTYELHTLPQERGEAAK
jgi:hypothetical protein